MADVLQKKLIKNENFVAIIDYGSPELLRKLELDEPIFLKAHLQTADKLNANKRIYPKNILIREDNKYQLKIKQNNALNELDHPSERDIIEYKTVSHKINKTWWEGQELWGTVEILSGKHFPCANILRGCLLHKIPIGFSSRGLGSEIDLGNDTFEVDEDYDLICYDAVTQPSTFGAYGYIAESVSKLRNDSDKKRKEIEKIIFEILK